MRMMLLTTEIPEGVKFLCLLCKKDDSLLKDAQAICDGRFLAFEALCRFLKFQLFLPKCLFASRNLLLLLSNLLS